MKSSGADFPDWLGPILVKELRQGVKKRGVVLSFVALQLVLSLLLSYYALLYAHDHTADDLETDTLSAWFWGLVGGTLLLVTPFRAFNDLAAERKSGTLELLFMSGLTSWRILWGKWISLLAQAGLFVFAVLPFGIARYFFGGVDLKEEFVYLTIVLIGCATLTAGALAASGLSMLGRVCALVLTALYLSFILAGMSEAFFFGGPVDLTAMSFGFLDWVFLVWDVAVVCLLALELGAGTIAPPAENHAGRQRFLTLLLFVPIILMSGVGYSPYPIRRQLLLFVSAAGFLLWRHLSILPAPQLSHVRPFAGWRAPFGLLFQPGWPSAVLFLLLETGLVTATLWPISRPKPADDVIWVIDGHTMAAAALLCSAAFVFALPARSRFVVQTIILVLGCVFTALIDVASPITPIGNFHVFAAVPPIAFWSMHQTSDPWGHEGWLLLSAFALIGYAMWLLILGRRFWVQYFRLCYQAARPRPTSQP